MQLDINLGDIDLEKELSKHIQRKFELSLSKVAPYISAVSITLSETTDVNTPSDKHCLLKLSLINLPDMVIEDTQTDIYYVIENYC